MQLRKTKIIATIGPASRDPEVFEALVHAGLSVARLNFSHGTHEYHGENIDMIKAVRKKLNLPIPILLDTKGPEIRIKTFENGQVELFENDEFFFTTKDIVGNQQGVSVTYDNLVQECFVGDKILLNNGLLAFEIIRIENDSLVTRVVEGGILSDRKSMNFPNKVFKLPYLSDQDKIDIKFGVEKDVDFIACSFVSYASDILAVRDYLKSLGKEDIDLIAKIENRAGVDNIEEILEVCDGVMVARGDMGVEIAYEKLPAIQKHIIHKCRLKGKRVITATEMLESMINNPRPTRAEISDVANAVYDGTSAIMLSGETAVGKYVVEAVNAMAKIALETEEAINYKKRFKMDDLVIKNTVDAVSHATCTVSIDIQAKALVVCTLTGSTARMVSRFRAPSPIIALTTDEKAWRKLNLSWGVTPVIEEEVPSTDVLFYKANKAVKKLGFASKGDLIVITAGTPISLSSRTNLIKVEVVN